MLCVFIHLKSVIDFQRVFISFLMPSIAVACCSRCLTIIITIIIDISHCYYLIELSAAARSSRVQLNKINRSISPIDKCQNIM